MGLLVAAVPPIRAMLGNLRTGEMKDVLLNPTELREQVQVHYGRLQVLGLSHQILQFTSTGNTTLPVTFYLDKLFAQAVSIGEDPDILDFKRFLQAFTLPIGPAEDIAGGGPPRALFLWPGLVSMTCVVTSLELRYQQFDVFGQVLVYEAKATFEEIRDVRITSDEVRAMGSERGGL